MLYAASVKVTYQKINRRIDVIVEADTQALAESKAVKHARSIYLPHKKAVYTVTGILNETEAMQSLTSAPTSPATETEPGDDSVPEETY